MSTERNNDTSYTSLNEIVGDYKPYNQISEDLVDWYINKLNLLEEGDTIITGSFKEWILLLGGIYDKLEKNENDRLDIHLSGLDTTQLYDRKVFEVFLNSVFSERRIGDDEKFIVTGTKREFERFYQHLKRFEFYKNKSVDF
jgi:hypothetical protein